MAQRNRSEIRQERYSLARELGFSTSEARSMRDWSAERIRGQVGQVQQQIETKPQRQRTPEEKTRLEKIRNWSRNWRDIIDIDVRSKRLETFRKWSKNRNFPPDIQGRISQINMDAGLDPLDSYGYRVWYHMFVNNVSEADAIERTERRDT